MTASSSVVLSNLAYLIGAVVLAIIGGLIVWLRHRTPKSVDANVESFHRGLRALAPDSSDGRGAREVQPLGWRMANPPGFPPAPVAGSEHVADSERAADEPDRERDGQADATTADSISDEEGADPAEEQLEESRVVDLSRDEPAEAEPAEAEPAGAEEAAGFRAGAEAG